MRCAANILLLDYYADNLMFIQKWKHLTSPCRTLIFRSASRRDAELLGAVLPVLAAMVPCQFTAFFTVYLACSSSWSCPANADGGTAGSGPLVTLGDICVRGLSVSRPNHGGLLAVVRRANVFTGEQRDRLLTGGTTLVHGYDHSARWCMGRGNSAF